MIKRFNKKGFTLVEIIVVLVILAIFAAIAVPAVLGYVDESKKTRYIEEAHSIYTVIQTEEARYKALGNEEEEILMLLDLGIAADGTGALPNHNSRKELTETITKKTDIQNVTFGTCSHIGKDNAKYYVNFKSDDGKNVYSVIKRNKDITVSVN